MPQKQPNKVGVVRFSALGDVVLTIPVLYDACVANPDVQFVMITRKAFVGLFINTPSNLTVRGIDLKKDYKGMGGMMRLAAELDVDTFIDLHSVLRTWMIDARLRMRGVRVVVFDKARKEKRNLVKKGAAKSGVISHVTERYADAFLNAGLALKSEFRGLFAEKPADSSLFASLHSPKKEEQLWIGVAPFAAHKGKVYPIDLIYKAIKAMVEDNPDAKVFLFGGGETETAILRRYAEEATPNKVFCVAGSKIGFGGELALMASLDVMVCMDSGNMHMAAIAGARTVSIWGATHPAAGFGPWCPAGKPKDWHRTLQVPRICRPCSVFGNKPCKYLEESSIPPCMSAIDPLSITFAALDINKKPII